MSVTRDLDRIRFVTQHFHDLQGLRYWVPLGLITLSVGGAMYFADWPMRGLLAILIPGAFLLMVGARRYYRNHFGEVEPHTVDLALDVYPATVFSPAGPAPRIQGARQVAPMARCLLATAALTLIFFSTLQTTSPSFRIESMGPSPRITSQSSDVLQRPWIIGNQPPPEGVFVPPWVPWVYSGVPTRPPSTLRAVFGQTVYVLYGSVFLGLWLWRGRRRSQNHHLALAILLLGLSASGASLGFLVRGGEIPGIVNILLPALVYPGVALLLCGSSMILAGLLDHQQLVRVLRGQP